MKIKVKFFYSPAKYNTGARLTAAVSKIDKFFLLLYGDNFWPFNFDRIWQSYKKNKKDTQIVVYKNDDNYSSSNVKIGKKNIVLDYDDLRIKNYEFVNSGFIILRKENIKYINKKNYNSKLEVDILKKLISRKSVSAYITQHRDYSLTNLKRYFITSSFFENRKKFILLDRDGVLNIKPRKGTYVNDLKKWKWKPDSLKAIKLLGRKKIKIIVISNQAGLSLNKLTLRSINQINENIKKRVTSLGGCIENILFCPHHWNDKCYCRKPNPGLLYTAQKLHNLDLTNTPFVGDQKTDKEAAHKANVPYYGINKKTSLYKLLKKIYI